MIRKRKIWQNVPNAEKTSNPKKLGKWLENQTNKVKEQN
jgi:hypothetical protein